MGQGVPNGDLQAGRPGQGQVLQGHIHHQGARLAGIDREGRVRRQQGLDQAAAAEAEDQDPGGPRCQE